MKLTLIGGGGVRSPLFVSASLRRAERIGLQELCLMDIDARKLAVFGALTKEIVRAAGDPFRVITTTNTREALEGASHVVTTIRVGFEQGRVFDERIALKHGVLGQETTGPGGFAMALRSIPVILGYAQLLEEISPGAWMYNFSNPAGLVTQALREAGYKRTVGICDGANTGQHTVAGWLKVKNDRLHAEVYGLNHLSWTRKILLDGKDVLAGLLRDPAFHSRTMLRMFDRELVEQIGMWLNEYLYYYYYAERAVRSITAEEKTRGEEILELNQRLLQQLEQIDVERNPQDALKAFYAYEHRRHSTYMHYALPDAPTPEEADLQASAEHAMPVEAGEGYAGVALGIVEALETGLPLYTALNVPNLGAIDGMREDDVVEVSCRVDRAGIHTLPIGEIPEAHLRLMQSVKLYEKLTVQAIRTHSRQTAIQALMAHPLVMSYSRAKSLVEEYLQAHATYVGEWI